MYNIKITNSFYVNSIYAVNDTKNGIHANAAKY